MSDTQQYSYDGWKALPPRLKLNMFIDHLLTTVYPIEQSVGDGIVVDGEPYDIDQYDTRRNPIRECGMCVGAHYDYFAFIKHGLASDSGARFSALKLFWPDGIEGIEGPTFYFGRGTALMAMDFYPHLIKHGDFTTELNSVYEARDKLSEDLGHAVRLEDWEEHGIEATWDCMLDHPFSAEDWPVNPIEVFKRYKERTLSEQE